MCTHICCIVIGEQVSKSTGALESLEPEIGIHSNRILSLSQQRALAVAQAALETGRQTSTQ